MNELEIAQQNLSVALQNFIAFYKEDHDFNKPVYPLWTAKDILSHVVFWHESFAANILDLANGIAPHALKGKLAELNEQSVLQGAKASIESLIQRLSTAQSAINSNIFSNKIASIPYRKSGRSYTPLEHLAIVDAHIKKHLKDLRRAF